jgi:serine/threonine-protein kinase
VSVCPICREEHPDGRGFCPPAAPTSGWGGDGAAAAAAPGEEPDARIGTSMCEGRYRVLEVVGRGGVARVYKAIDVQANRTVALKILHSAYASQSVVVERFWREYRFSSLVKHPNLVDIVAFRRCEDAVLALVMEYLEGETVFALLEREGRIAPARLVPIVAQIALGLGAAHDKKLVHRDLKPGNVFLCAAPGAPGRDLVKLLDFGVARDNSPRAQQLTATGAVIGTPSYMSPEQVRGERELDQRTDIWSLGVLVYECLTGRLPFSGKSYQATLAGILGEPAPPPSQLELPEPLPVAFDAWIERALAKAPDARFASAGELADAFGRAFGLPGDHRAWAESSPDALGRALEPEGAGGGDGI